MQEIQKSSDRRKARGDETRQRILSSAIFTISTQGLSNLTLDRVGEHAGVSRTLVVFHFKSKTLLIQEALEYLGKMYSEGWDAVAANAEGTTLERILRLIDFDIRFPFEHPEYLSAWAAFWGESRGSQMYREQAVPRDQRYASETKELIGDFMEEEGYDKDDLDAIMTALNAIQFGFWVESHLDPEANDYQAGTAAVRLFFAKIFPNHEIPHI